MTTATTTDYFALADAAGTYRFTVDQYHRMLDVGVLTEGEPVELLEGYVVKKWDREAGRDGSRVFPHWSGLRMFTVPEYHRMIDAGILTPDDAVELLEGYVVNKMSHNSSHSATISRITIRLLRRLPAGWTMRFQLPITLAASEPEPDAAIVRGDETTYDIRHPVPADVGVVIEVADSTLITDRRDKGNIYAAAGIPVYWVVNVIDRQIEVYTVPLPAANPPAYAIRTDYPHGGAVPVALDGVAVATLAVADLIP